jgi:hypothetical protein
MAKSDGATSSRANESSNASTRSSRTGRLSSCRFRLVVPSIILTHTSLLWTSSKLKPKPTWTSSRVSIVLPSFEPLLRVSLVSRKRCPGCWPDNWLGKRAVMPMRCIRSGVDTSTVPSTLVTTWVSQTRRRRKPGRCWSVSCPRIGRGSCRMQPKRSLSCCK